MSLNLDARQRAMLQEMGVTVWTRAETTAPLAPAAMQPVTVCFKEGSGSLFYYYQLL